MIHKKYWSFCALIQDKGTSHKIGDVTRFTVPETTRFCDLLRLFVALICENHFNSIFRPIRVLQRNGESFSFCENYFIKMTS